MKSISRTHQTPKQTAETIADEYGIGTYICNDAEFLEVVKELVATHLKPRQMVEVERLAWTMRGLPPALWQTVLKETHPTAYVYLEIEALHGPGSIGP